MPNLKQGTKYCNALAKIQFYAQCIKIRDRYFL
jgi:hypothetical protein